ncbi:lysophospholipid acyltransferase family protein [Aurantiacibacter aquimixticola]|uniref:1-acyl-sn-glycerol-3-phosphate acyltransferase n=1 Tax=Aurantiacibacter aquimixticola TaxID=1958945 RepID=A0A419RQL6_9SPHN|nr:lysophospholipid acyltransferase family protein [Aurantiacibacter aquimixticola]RJY08055.1 1-acyl-sn-glycerol-3-phosphate acyltransferase [Aurantiacibacter aquimixticola]
MSKAVAAQTAHISLIGYLLIALRLPLMLALLLICVPLHYLWRMLGLDRTWPRVFLTGVGFVIGLRIRRQGKRVPGALLLANHVSWMDILALSQAANSAYVAHDGLARFGFLKWLCEMNETVFVARHRRAEVSKQAVQIRAALDHGGTLTLFPEGTTADGTVLLPFKSSLLGALEPLPEGASVQPVLLDYADAPQIAWVGEEPGLDNFKRILARLKPLRIDVHFFQPLEGEELTNRKTMTAAARGQIERALLSSRRNLS